MVPSAFPHFSCVLSLFWLHGDFPRSFAKTVRSLVTRERLHGLILNIENVKRDIGAILVFEHYQS